MNLCKCVGVALLLYFSFGTPVESFEYFEHRRYPLIVQNQLSSENENSTSRPSFDEYIKTRRALLQAEIDSSFESDVSLTAKENLANEIIMRAKAKEVNAGHINPYSFNPSRHIFEVLDSIQESELFKILRKMPKGGILHAHDTALCSANYLVNITYQPNLWQCSNNDKIAQFLFSRYQPNPIYNIDCQWKLVTKERERLGVEKYDKYVRTLFTLFDRNVNPKTQFADVNSAWNRFMQLFIYVGPLVTYAPIWKSYYKQALKEMYEDNVQYLEFRGLLPEVYDLDGNIYKEADVMRLYYEALQEFKIDYSDFIGSKFIYGPLKAVQDNVVEKYFQNVVKLNDAFPDFLAGFDLVGQEDTSPSITRFAERALKLPENITFFFHAGETNWFGSVDENLIDAVVLGTKRIGHGYALAKHPKVMEIVKEKDIAIEINPISNQVLKLVDDYRNHPAATFFARNIPLVVSSDDPSFWEVTPLTHDFYMAFLGITSSNSDLRTLKKLAKNSIKYSSLNETEKTEAFGKWQDKWDLFIDELIKNDQATGGSS